MNNRRMKVKSHWRSRPVALLALAMLVWVGIAGAQVLPQNPSQFDVTGFIQAATLDNPANLLSGGTITVNHQLIVVPANTILQMPATALTWQQVFALAPAPYGLGSGPLGAAQSGLALSDVPKPFGTYEVHVQGNRVGDSYIAGLMFLSQHSLQSSQGFINFIDYSTGFFEVGGVMGTQGTGQRVKINDPAGIFGRAWTPDPRFTINEKNATVRTETGFPMCLPRAAGGDAACPQTNRPLDATSPSGFKMIFTMTAPALVAAGTTDPNLMAPFEVGDYVTYSGILVKDPAPATTVYVAAYSVIGNVGIYTAAGTSPAYVAVDVTILGTGGSTVAGLVEATARTRFEGFTTDPSRHILLFGVDVDPCSGGQTPRNWGSIDVDQGPPNGAVLGRWRFRPPSKVLTMPAAGAWDPPTRDFRAVIETVLGSGIPAAPVVTSNGLVVNQYQTPITELLFPENIAVGAPIVPNNFDVIPYLAQGSGPLGAGLPSVGQLSPWPGLTVPLVSACPVPGAPTANAGVSQTVSAGALVTLSGTGTDPNGLLPLSFVWIQTGGTAVALAQNIATGQATFTAPVPFGTAVVLTFSLTVTNSAGVASAPSTVTITVNPVASDLVTISTVEYRVANLRLTVNAGSSASTAIPPAQLTMQAYDINGVKQGAPQPMTLSAGIYTVILVGVPQPDHVTVTSDHGGSATSKLTRLR